MTTEEALKRLLNCAYDHSVDFDGRRVNEDDLDAYEIVEKRLATIDAIEKEVGCDIATLLKALNNGVWFSLKDFYGIREEDQTMFIECVTLGKSFILCGTYTYDGERRSVSVLPEHYGRTWALTKEELK